MRIVVAPDSFKGSLSARGVAEAVAAGWARVRPGDELVLAPIADGGEGTLDAFEVAVPGALRVPVTVTGPDDRPVEASWLLLPTTSQAPGGVGVVELASTSGITLLDPLRPVDAHTVGFGEAIAAALDRGVSALLLGLGGSSSTDGGAGALGVLGARLLDAEGRPVRRGNRGLHDLALVDLAGLRPLPAGGATVLSDVSNPLLGPRGAAAVFGPQKGADAAMVTLLEAGLRTLASLLPVDPALPGMGAAGGTTFGLAAWGAGAVPGAERIAEVIGLAEAITGADLVITGEGRYDAQSEGGKAPSHVLALAERAGVPAALIAGRVDAPTSRFAAASSLTELAGSAEAAIAEPARWLDEAAALLAATR